VSARERLASYLARERRRRGVTQQELAADLGLDLRHYRKIEAGEVDVTLSTLDRIARGLAVDVSDLLKRPRVRRSR
jgi:transcriptional regulator with XRE-family HTH domain